MRLPTGQYWFKSLALTQRLVGEKKNLRAATERDLARVHNMNNNNYNSQKRRVLFKLPFIVM